MLNNAIFAVISLIIMLLIISGTVHQHVPTRVLYMLVEGLAGYSSHSAR